MSAPDHTVPTSGSSGFSVWTLLRIAGIVVGVATLLRLAGIGFQIEYQAFFQTFLDTLTDIIELGFVTGPIELLVRNTLAWVGGALNVPIPDLAPAWRSTFGLLWLLFLSSSRHVQYDTAAGFPVATVWSFFIAVVTAMACNLGFGGIATSGNYLNIAGIGIAIFYYLHPGRVLFGRFFPGMIVLIEAMGIMLNVIQLTSLSPLFALSIYVMVFGVFAVILGVLATPGPTADRLGSPLTATGLDVSGVMGLALGIGYLMMK